MAVELRSAVECKAVALQSEAEYKAAASPAVSTSLECLAGL